MNAKPKLKPCPKCKDAWYFVSDGDYYSDYESLGIRVSCRCGYAWEIVGWQKTYAEAAELWNRRVE